jgi:hypothetical protein
MQKMLEYKEKQKRQKLSKQSSQVYEICETSSYNSESSGQISAKRNYKKKDPIVPKYLSILGERI